ncbi:hypothetical protein LCGC14_0267080 [marine sediment metagenome]|uniref:Uncharacterized protein n=1 Tax=marine sediment metagenome TaxID=412755 RepID=A0A0F9UGN7_9ZZZZ
MRMCRIPELDYADFEKIRDAIFSVIPFSVFEVQYSKELKTGYFNFWDSDYIPAEMSKYIVQPPLSRENKALLHKKLIGVMKSLQNKDKVANIG